MENSNEDNFWHLLDISYGFIPQALRILYSQLYQRRYPGRINWTSPLDTNLPPELNPPLASSSAMDVNSTVFRYYEEFGPHLSSKTPNPFKFPQNQELFLNQQFEDFDVTFLCALLLQSSVKENLVSFDDCFLINENANLGCSSRSY